MRIKALIIAVCVALFATTAHGQVQLSAITDEWAASGTEFDAIKMNVTNTASAAGSDLLDLQIGGTTYFGVKKTGEIRTPLDSVGLLFGAGGDATLWYDGTDVLLDARAVGTGDLIVKGDLMPHADSTYTLGTTGVRYSDGFVDAFTIGGALTSVGTITVGVDDTGYDVKFFGASAGAFSLYDESADTLIIRGPTAAGPGLLNLSTGELTNVDGGVLGRINFQAPLDSAGTDAILVAASIWGEADATFSASVNTTDLVFALGTSEAAVEQFRMTAAGNFNLTTGDIILPEKADHTATPIAAKMQLWAKNTVPTALYATDDAGKDTQLTGTGVFNVKDYGATGDGSTDDHANLTTAIAAASGHTLYFPNGTYLLSETLVFNVSCRVILGNGVIIKNYDNNYTDTPLVTIDSVTNGSFEGNNALIQQDYSGGTWPSGQQRSALAITNCTDFVVRDLRLKSDGGDGLYVGGDTMSGMNFDTLIENVHVLEGGRNGISVIAGNNVTLKDCIVEGVLDRQSPKCGVDFEPNNANDDFINVRLINCTTLDAPESGILITGIELTMTSADKVEITIVGHTDVGSKNGFLFNPGWDADRPAPKVRYIDGYCLESEEAGIGILDPVADEYDVRIINPIVINYGQTAVGTDYLDSGIYIADSARWDGTVTMGGVIITNPTIHESGETLRTMSFRNTDADGVEDMTDVEVIGKGQFMGVNPAGATGFVRETYNYDIDYGDMLAAIKMGPTVDWHLNTATPHSRIEQSATSGTAYAIGMAGIELVGGASNATNKFGPVLKFMCDDPDFTTETPKLLAAIAGVPTETYGADTDSGMAIEFATTPDNNGATSIPVLAMTLDQDGSLDLASGDFILNEKADHTATPAAGKMQLWTKNTVPTTLMATDDAGRDYAISDEGVFNVKAYGAVGDGSTDDSTAIQACIDAAEAAGGGTVLFPDGLDFVTDGHTIDGGNNVTLRSDGYATLTFASAGLTITSDNITIENLHLDGDATIATCVTVSDNATDTRIANCKIGNVSGTNAAGVLVSGDGSDRTIVENCHIYDVIGVTTGRGIRLVGNTTPATGIRGVKLVNNYITNIQPLADGDGIVVQDWTDNCDVLIQGNTFIQCEKRGVKLQSPGCTVIGNYFEMADVGADTPLTAIDVQTQNTRVIGNIITGYTSDHFINIGSTSAGFEGDNVIVSGNQLLPTAGHGEAGLDMIQINGGTGITITDNQILGGDFRFAVDTNGSSAEILIQGNIFDGGSSNSIQVADTGKILTNTVITNNKFLNVGGFVVTDGGLGAFGNNVVYDQTNVTDGSESSPTSGDGIHRTPGSKEVTTTDATVTTLELVDTANDAVYHAEAIVMATETAAHDEMASYHIAGTFRNDGGTLTQVGATTVIHSAEDTVGWDCDFDVNADDIRLRVTGAAATNVNWRGRITWDKSD